MIRTVAISLLFILSSVSLASPAPENPVLDAKRKLLNRVSQKMTDNKTTSERLLMWTTDYIVILADLPRDEAYTALNKLSDFYESFKHEEKVAFAVFILNQKEIKDLLDRKDVRDLLFEWTIKILENHPLNEEHSQNLLMYWAETTKTYADGLEFRERIEKCLEALGMGLPSVPAMSDWFHALETMIKDHKEGHREALLSFIPVIRNNRILNSIIIPNMDFNLAMRYPHWLHEIKNGFKISNLEFAYIFPLLWKELNKIVKDNLFKVPSTGKTVIPEHISDKADHPLSFTLDLQRNFRTLLFKEFIEYNFEKERTMDHDALIEALNTYDTLGYFEELENSYFKLPSDVFILSPEQKNKVQELTQYMISNFPESKLDLIYHWMMVMSPAIDFNSLNLEKSTLTLTPESPGWIIWLFKNQFPDVWTGSKQKFFTTLLTTKDHQNISMRHIQTKILMNTLTQAAQVPEDHLIAFLMYIYLKQAFKADTQDFSIPLFVQHNDDPAQEQTFMFEHYTELEQLHTLISPQLLAIGLNELDTTLLPTVAQELIVFIKKKLEKETLDEQFSTERQQIVNDILEFQTQLLAKSKTEDEFRASYLPLTPAAVSSIGRAIHEDEEELQGSFESTNTESTTQYETDMNLDEITFEKGSEHLIKAIKELKTEDFKNKHTKTYFTDWIPLHYLKATKDARKKFLDDLMGILEEYDHPDFLHRLRLIIQSFMRIPRSEDTEYSFIYLTQLTIQHADPLSQDSGFALGEVVFNEAKLLFSYLTDPCMSDFKKIEFNELRSSLFSLISASEIGNGDFGKPELNPDEKDAFIQGLNTWFTALIYNSESVGENGNKIFNFPSSVILSAQREGSHRSTTDPETMAYLTSHEFEARFIELNPGRKDEIEHAIHKLRCQVPPPIDTALPSASTPQATETMSETDIDRTLHNDRYNTLSYFRSLTRFIRELSTEDLNRFFRTIESEPETNWTTQTKIFNFFITTIKNSAQLKYTYKSAKELLKLIESDPSDTHTPMLMILDSVFPTESTPDTAIHPNMWNTDMSDDKSYFLHHGESDQK